MEYFLWTSNLRCSFKVLINRKKISVILFFIVAVFTVTKDWPFLCTRWRQNKFPANKATDSLCLFFVHVLYWGFQLSLVFDTFSNFIFGRIWGNIWSLFSGFTAVLNIYYALRSMFVLELLIFAGAKWGGMCDCFDIWWLSACVELTLIHFIYFKRDANRSLPQMNFLKEIACMFVVRNLWNSNWTEFKGIVLKKVLFVYRYIHKRTHPYIYMCTHMLKMPLAYILLRWERSK